MSFLDNLENNLKALEGREEGGADDRSRRETDLKNARAAAPWAEKLKTSPWTKNLMAQATRAGFQRRFKVNLVWLGTTLRLEARGLRLELRPTPEGVSAVSLDRDAVTGERQVDFEKDPAPLVAEWMDLIDRQVISTLPDDPEETES